MKKIFVGNLSWKATEDMLKQLFEAFGEVVSVKIIKDQYTDKSKGFGFVEMRDAEGAEKAIRELNDKPFLERNLRVSQAQERTERSGGREGGSRDGGSRDGGGMGREYRGGGGGGAGGGQRPFRPRVMERNYSE